MEIFRARNPDIVRYMHFLDDPDITKKESAKELLTTMIATPDDVFVAVIFDEDELVGHACGIKKEGYIWTYNAWAKNTLDSKYSAQGFDLIKDWAKKQGFKSMRCETFRSPEAMERAYGWEKYSTIMQLNF